ncbi:hypothetical protein C1645_817824 [Glomus cerebriforme]|uniref:Uncharacterized protein n=1 Tax=Glomus cerebriforme TaxID=658196 RepID=A0A397TDM4_9GLOM|nr:hypothetical protein C1645_817824 [Glomus cerebriforme]
MDKPIIEVLATKQVLASNLNLTYLHHHRLELHRLSLTLDDALAASAANLDATVITAAIVTIVANSSLNLLKYFGDSLGRIIYAEFAPNSQQFLSPSGYNEYDRYNEYSERDRASDRKARRNRVDAQYFDKFYTHFWERLEDEFDRVYSINTLNRKQNKESGNIMPAPFTRKVECELRFSERRLSQNLSISRSQSLSVGQKSRKQSSPIR